LKFSQFFIFIFFITIGYAQNKHEFVSIEEKVTGKRIELFAVNTNNIDYDVFLKVDAKGYRRSSSRPIIKTIPANSKVKMMTVVELKGVESSYTYTLIVNEIGFEMSVQKDHKDFDLKIDESLKSKEVTLFIKDNCLLCNETKLLLGNNKINYKEYNIDQDSTYLITLIKTLKKKEVKTKIHAPVIKIEDSIYTKIKTQQELIKVLKTHYSY